MLIPDHGQQQIAGEHDLVRVRSAGIGLQGLAGPGIQFGDRRVNAEGHVERVVACHQAPGHGRGAGLVGKQARDPLAHGPLPEHRTVVRVPGRELPVRREEDRCRGALIHDVEDSSLLGHHGGKARHLFMEPAPSGAASPLQVARRCHHRVAGHGIVAGIVQILRPVIRVRCERLAQRLPRLLLAKDCQSAR